MKSLDVVLPWPMWFNVNTERKNEDDASTVECASLFVVKILSFCQGKETAPPSFRVPEAFYHVECSQYASAYHKLIGVNFALRCTAVFAPLNQNMADVLTTW